MSKLMKEAAVACDAGCGNVLVLRVLKGTPPEAVRTRMRRRGWRRIAGRDLCPECVAKALRAVRAHMDAT